MKTENKEREILKLTSKEAKNIVYDDDSNFEQISEEIIDQRRWVTSYRKIMKHISDGKFFCFEYDNGSTEYQDERPYEYCNEVEIEEVFPVEKTVTAYE